MPSTSPRTSTISTSFKWEKSSRKENLKKSKIPIFSKSSPFKIRIILFVMMGAKTMSREKDQPD